MDDSDRPQSSDTPIARTLKRPDSSPTPDDSNPTPVRNLVRDLGSGGAYSLTRDIGRQMAKRRSQR
jgi:hypothetical protein